jgi:phosphatidylethanolamine/phosphatidyl-N-methylethanolamine N-methyltransferase
MPTWFSADAAGYFPARVKSASKGIPGAPKTSYQGRKWILDGGTWALLSLTAVSRLGPLFWLGADIGKRFDTNKDKRAPRQPHESRGQQMQLEYILKSYARYAPVYDQTFGWLLSFRGRSMAAGVTNKRPGKVLEVGVGTGISLSYYRKEHQVHGIDISPDMLAIAQKRVHKGKLAHVSSLSIMDAREMEFEDGAFDSVVAAYVMSVVPEPDKVIREIERVCKPGGDVVIVNHFAAEKGVRRNVEAMLAPLSNKLGWRPDMPVEEILANTGLREVKRHMLPPLGMFTMLHLKKDH